MTASNLVKEREYITYLNHHIRNQRLISKKERTLIKLIKELETTRDKAIHDAAEASLKDKQCRESEALNKISWMRKQHKSVKMGL
jgi:hypothetical protein